MVVRFGYRDHVPTMRPMYDCKFVANIVTLSIYLLNGGVPVLAATDNMRNHCRINYLKNITRLCDWTMFIIEQKFSDSQEFPCFLMEYIRTHDRGAAVCTRKNLTTCQQDVFATGLQQACQQVVTM
jgi:hypothetical protein